MDLIEAQTQLKESWKKIVYDYSDATAILGADGVKKKMKMLNSMIELMPMEAVLEELQENNEFIVNFKK